MKKILALLLLSALVLCTAAASAEELELNATVTATQTVTLSAPAAGQVAMCIALAGDHVEAGEALMALETSKTYASQDGVIRIFGQPGDNLETLAARYGGVAYLEPAQRYTIAGSTRKAYNHDDNKLIHAGETVYLRGASNKALEGTGCVTNVSGSSYTVVVEGNTFTSGITVNIYRDPAYSSTSLIGSGKTAQASAEVYTGTGCLVRWHVENGQQVSAGDLLYESLDGSFAPGSSDLDQLTAQQPGVIAAVYANKGKTVAAAEALIDFYPDEGLRVAATVAEGDLQRLQPGMTVSILLPGEDDPAKMIPGTVEKLALVANAAEDSAYGASYTAYILPEAADTLPYGMNVTVLVP